MKGQLANHWHPYILILFGTNFFTVIRKRIEAKAGGLVEFVVLLVKDQNWRQYKEV